MNFKEIYEKSIKNPEDFWKSLSDDIFWFKKPTKILNSSNPPFYKWYEDGKTNTCYNALDLHVENGLGDNTALIYDSPITGNKAKYTFNELKSRVSKFAGALKNQGVEKGDRVVIYMPMVPEAVIAMLACGRIGAIHSVVFGGFASNELASRIDDSKAKILVTSSCGFEPNRTVKYRPLVDGALNLAKHKLKKVIFYQRKGHEIKLNEQKNEIVINDANGNQIKTSENGIDLLSHGKLNIKAMSGLSITCGGGIELDSKLSDVSLKGGNITNKASSKFSVDAVSALDLASSGIAELKGSLIKIN